MFAGVDVTIEGSAADTILRPELSFSRGFPEDFPSPTHTAEMGGSSGITS